MSGLYWFHSLERIGMSIAIGHYIYLDDDEAAHDQDSQDLNHQWQNWLDRVFG